MSRARALLRTVLLALGVAFAVGFGIGTWLRCAAERPEPILGARSGRASGVEPGWRAAAFALRVSKVHGAKFVG